MENLNAIMQFSIVEPEQNWAEIAIDGEISGGVMDVDYKTIEGNKPNAYNNYLAIWEAKKVPWKEKPLKYEVIGQTPDKAKGSWGFQFPLEYNEEYVLGYSVVKYEETKTGGETVPSNVICALAHIPAEGCEYTYEHTYLTLDFVKGNSLSVRYNMLQGYQPAKFGNWIGFFDGYADLYSDVPSKAIAVTGTRSIDTIVFNGISIERGSRYRLGYYMGGWNEDKEALIKTGLACMITFET